MTILITILGLAILILVHEFGHFLCAKLFHMRVNEFGIGFPPKIIGKKFGETLYSLNLLPLGGFVRIHGENGIEEAAADPCSFAVAPAWKRAVVIIAGVCMNFAIGWLIISAIFFIGTPKAVVIDEVRPESPAAVAGLKPGDIVEQFDEAKILVAFIEAHKGETITLQVKHDGATTPVAIVLRKDTKPNEGILGVVLGDAGIVPHPFFESLREGLKLSLQMMWSVLAGLGQIVWTLGTKGKLLEGFVGPVGVFGIAGAAAKTGWIYFIQLLGFISLNLAVLNVMPFPALDGGRLLFILIEKLKGSRLTPKFEMGANITGFVLLLVVIFAVTARDLVALF